MTRWLVVKRKIKFTIVELYSDFFFNWILLFLKWNPQIWLVSNHLGLHFGWQAERGVGRVVVRPHHEHARQSQRRPSQKNDVGIDNVVAVVANVARINVAFVAQRKASEIARRKPRSDSSRADEQVHRLRQTGESDSKKCYSNILIKKYNSL